MQFALLDTSFSAISLAQVLDSFKIRFLFIGARKKDYFARKRERDWLKLDYSDEAALALLTESGFTTIPGTNDDSLRAHCSASKCSASFQTLIPLMDKKLFAETAESVGLPVPKQRIWDDPGPPLAPKSFFVKPVDSFGGRGQSMLLPSASSEERREAWEFASSFSKSDEVILQESVEGQLFSNSVFFVDGKIRDAFVVDEWVDLNLKVHLSVVRHDLTLSTRTLAALEALRRELQFSEGLLHLQGIRTKGGHEYFLEATSRHPGDLFGNLVSESTGFNYTQAFLSFFVDEIPYPARGTKRDIILRQTFRADKSGKFLDLDVADKSQVIDTFLELDKHSRLDLGSRIGVAFSRLASWSPGVEPQRFMRPVIQGDSNEI